ncbi:unnamed protein product, partial [marine sediment metagenome]
VILKGTRVDGIYNADPEKDPTAKRYENISFEDCISKNLKVMDMTAFTLCIIRHAHTLLYLNQL